MCCMEKCLTQCAVFAGPQDNASPVCWDFARFNKVTCCICLSFNQRFRLTRVLDQLLLQLVHCGHSSRQLLITCSSSSSMRGVRLAGSLVPAHVCTQLPARHCLCVFQTITFQLDRSFPHILTLSPVMPISSNGCSRAVRGIHTHSMLLQWSTSMI
jgi:hypothetical protein